MTTAPTSSSSSATRQMIFLVALSAIVWVVAYNLIQPLAHWIS